VTFVLRKGSAFLVPSGPRDLLHLHIVLTEADADGMHLVATVSSVKEGIEHDKTCVLPVGEHAFITKPSYVVYGLTTQMR
jgi:hypothetical protein